jgi:rare lipoprotein A
VESSQRKLCNVRLALLQAVALLAVILGGCAGSPQQRAQGDLAWPSSPPESEVGWATYYSSRLAGRPTATGERYDPAEMTAAHRTLPFGTWIQVRRTDGRSVLVRINDRGPYRSGRIVDLSRRAAEELGMIEQGKVWVEIHVVRRPGLSGGSVGR